ncbi:DEAD/DEAH box helicase family protein [Limibaculum sp. M0105]|uniref:DEAD/DEAH box helicase family protein n=1 Tax=Thermohalobaculum xanthum TaxID=2753746 RepID=A0A8J7SFX9_9RHOB|nr:type I restriction endonuclease subunit R [Thermohalobaculum xanthum]MBK0399822.1 DEAD/DEAH box helicase family protein [Thermohalobaculum xanthum]
MSKNEAFSRAKIDALLSDVGWNTTDGRSVLFEYHLPDGTRADYVLFDRRGLPVAVIEAKKMSTAAITAQDQGRHYAKQLGIPFVFLSNGEEIRFLDADVDAHSREIASFFSQEDLERRMATRTVRRDLTSVDTDRSIVERDYQVECIDTLCREITHGRRKLLVEMATGTGKTRTAAALIKRLFEAGHVTRVLFLVDRITLASQTLDAFTDHLRGYPSYILRGGRQFDHAKRVTISTLQTMVNEYDQLSSGYFDLVITDECHRSIYGQWSGVLRHFDGIQIGLTATPCTVDAKDLPDPEDGLFVRDTLRFFEVDKPTFSYNLHQAITDGHLVPYRIYKAKTVKTAAEGGFEVKRGELDWTAMDAQTKAEFEELFDGGDTIVVDPNSLERRFTIPERNRAMVREFRDVIDNGYCGSDGVKRLPQKGKTIVFAVNKRHAETLATMFDQHFADLKPHSTTRYADFVVSDLGGGPTPDAQTIIKRFKDDEFPKILVSVNMLDTGFDCPEVVNLVMARFTKSAILYQQMRGRGTRKAEHIGKAGFTMFDFVGVSDFHGDDDETIPGGFVITTKPASGTPTSRSLLTLDVHDHIDPASRDWVTLDADGRIVRTTEHDARAAQLGLRFEAWFETRALSAEQERWVRMIKNRIEADATEIDGFWDYDLDEHPFDRMGGCDQALRVFGGQSALDDLLGSLNVAVFGPDGDSGKADKKDQPRT